MKSKGDVTLHNPMRKTYSERQAKEVLEHVISFFETVSTRLAEPR